MYLYMYIHFTYIFRGPIEEHTMPSYENSVEILTISYLVFGVLHDQALRQKFVRGGVLFPDACGHTYKFVSN